MSKRYAYAKATLPTDWAAKTASDIKIEIKRYMLQSVLRRRKEKTVRDYVARMLAEFCEEFDPEEREIAEGYREELTDFSEEVYQSIKKMVGNMPAAVFVSAVADPRSLSERQKADVEKYSALEISLPPDAVKRYAKSATVDGAFTRGTAGNTYYADVHKEVKAWMDDDFLNKTKTSYGTRVNARNLAEMNVRYQKYQDTKQQLISEGVKLVYVPPHSNCSERCQPWQGRVYSLDGTSGSIDGRSYVPIERASDEVKYVSPKTGKEYPAGLFSYNCRHTIKPYKQGQNIEQIPKSEIREKREIEARQRYMERQIRLFKEKEQLYRTLNAESPNADILKTARDARKKARDLTRQYEAFSRSNGVPFYRERTRIVAGEDIYARTQGHNDPVLIKS